MLMIYQTIFFFYVEYGDHRDQHLLPPSCPSRRLSYSSRESRQRRTEDQALAFEPQAGQRRSDLGERNVVGEQRVGFVGNLHVEAAIFAPHRDRKSTRLNSSH